MVKKIVLSFFVASAIFGADNQKDLNLINANIAYEQGITGSGVNVGVIDGAAKMDHPSLQGQVEKQIYSKYNGQDYSPNFSVDTHGTHVTSTIVGADLGSNMPHGVAFGAKSYNIQSTGYMEYGTKTFAKITDFITENNVKIINNSWNVNLFPLVGTNMLDYFFYDNYGADYWLNDAFNKSPIARELADIARKDLALVIFAAGNEGIISPGEHATFRSYDESIKSYLVVGSVDAGTITKNDKGQLVLTGASLQMNGNGFKKATNYALMAPGVNIQGAYSADNGYIAISGTSQAAPHVSGAAALVMEKFPFLKPSQVADVLLSTANKNIIYPKAILKETNGVYTIFYINSTAPKDNEQIKSDLLAAKYDLATINKALASVHPDEDYYSLIQNVSFEDVFGQGILDIGKAMGGLAVLDANRLTDGDVEVIDKKFNGNLLEGNTPKAYYSIDTKSYDTEFLNDISQRKWDENTHLSTGKYDTEEKVLNKPTKLAGLDIGLKKIGSGTLTLSGNNTYAGPTLLKEGSLVLNGQIQGNLYIEGGTLFTLNDALLKNESARKNNVFVGGNVLNEGTFRGVGEVKGHFINQGILKAGFFDENIQNSILTSDILNIGGTFFQTSPNAEIHLAFTKDKTTFLNSQLKAKSYNVTNGKLVFVPLQSSNNLFKAGDQFIVTIDSGLISNENLDISIQNKNLITFEFDKNTKILKAPSPEGEEESGQSQEDSENTEQGGNTEQQDSYEDQGANEKEQESQSESAEQSSSKDDKNQGNTGSEPQNQSSRQTIVVVAKNTNDNSIKALQSVLSNKSASSATKSALAQLDNLTPSEFNEALNSIKDTPNSANINTIDTLQKGLNIKSTLFLLDNFSGMGALNTSSVVFAPTAAFGDEYLGKVDDIYIKTQASAGIAYRRTNHDDYKQNMYMLDIQGKKQISDNSLLGGFIGFANAKTTKDYSEVRSNIFSLGLSYNHDFGSFGILGSTSVGMSFNNYDQSIKYISGSETSADYKNYFASFQIGAYKSFMMGENSSFAPLAMIDYSVIKQDSFDQSGALAKHYDSSTTNYSRAWLGMSFNHKLEFQNSWTLNSSLFAFYWHKLGNSDINQDLSFIESAGGKFDSKTTHEKQGFYGGIALEARKNNKFLKVSFSDEKTSAYNQYEIMLRAGVNF